MNINDDITKVLLKVGLEDYEIDNVFARNKYLITSIDDDVLDTVLFSEDVKNKIKAECDISSAFFQVILGKLRKVGILKEGKINPRFIPNFKDEEDFKLLLYFDIDETE